MDWFFWSLLFAMCAGLTRTDIRERKRQGMKISCSRLWSPSLWLAAFIWIQRPDPDFQNLMDYWWPLTSSFLCVAFILGPFPNRMEEHFIFLSLPTISWKGPCRQTIIDLYWDPCSSFEPITGVFSGSYHVPTSWAEGVTHPWTTWSGDGERHVPESECCQLGQGEQMLNSEDNQVDLSVLELSSVMQDWLHVMFRTSFSLFSMCLMLRTIDVRVPMQWKVS